MKTYRIIDTSSCVYSFTFDTIAELYEFLKLNEIKPVIIAQV